MSFCPSNCNNPVQVVGACDATSINDFNSRGFGQDWKELSVFNLLDIPAKKPDVESVEKVIVDVCINSAKVVNTPGPGTNREGSSLTGKKIVINGVVRLKVVYTSLTTVQSVHSAHFELPFCTFIVAGGTVAAEYCIDACVEDVFLTALNPRQLFANITLFLTAKPLNPSNLGCP